MVMNEDIPGLKLRPVTVKSAQAYVHEHHRHLRRIQGGLFAVGVEAEKRLVGVGIAGNPARVWQGTGRVAITRVATDGTPNACSMIYGALSRAAKALGYLEIWTYTLESEPGVSLRAAGFVDMGMSAGGTHSRPNRQRNPPVEGGRKRRWMRELMPGGVGT